MLKFDIGLYRPITVHEHSMKYLCIVYIGLIGIRSNTAWRARNWHCWHLAVYWTQSRIIFSQNRPEVIIRSLVRRAEKWESACARRITASLRAVGITSNSNDCPKRFTLWNNISCFIKYPALYCRAYVHILDKVVSLSCSWANSTLFVAPISDRIVIFDSSTSIKDSSLTWLTSLPCDSHTSDRLLSLWLIKGEHSDWLRVG